MKKNNKILLLVSLALVCVTSFAQPKEKLDTVYYDSNWLGCSRTFATYYRVMTIPTDDNPRKQFRDYFITGEIQGEANYISIDREDDSKSVFDGDVIAYHKNGKVAKQSKWANGHQVGDAYSFYENGKVQTHAFVNEHGQIDGETSHFDEGGNLIAMLEYHNGIPNTYLSAFNQMGAMGRYDVNTGAFVPEAVSPKDMKTKLVKGDKCFYYDDKNGIYLSIFVDAVKHYGKYYRIGIALFNNTSESIVFDPTQITAHGRFFKKSKKKGNENTQFDDIYADNNPANYSYDPSAVTTKDIRVWTYEDYTKKVHRRQQWDEALVAMAEGFAAGSAGYSTSTSTSTTYGSAYGTGSGYASAYGSGGYAYGSYNSNAYVHGSSTTTTTTRTYDATAAAIAQERAAYNVATYSASLEADTEAINENYLQVTTLDPQSEIAGYILLNKDKPNIIDLTIPVNGVAYQFHLTEIPK